MTLEIIEVLTILGITILLFVSEKLRVDVVAILIMLVLAWTGLITPEEAFSGLASNAVIAVIGVMILGYGVEKSGLVNRLTRPILQVAGTSEIRLIALVCSVVGLLSAFMQNIGSTVIFLPAILRISKNTGIPASRLLMPLGFSAILGGTVSMVGSGPLIILNDLLRQGGQRAFGLFSVTPMGLTLLLAGILYFLIFGKFVLPAKTSQKPLKSPQQELVETWHLPTTIHYCFVPETSLLVGKTREETDLWNKYSLNLLAIVEGEDTLFAPWRYTRFQGNQTLIVLGDLADVKRFARNCKIVLQKEKPVLEIQPETQAGFAEVIIPPHSSLAGKSLRQIAMRKTFTVEPIMLFSGDREQRQDFSDEILQPGDALIFYGTWENLRALEQNQNCVLVTKIEKDARRKTRPGLALGCFLAAISLAIAGFSLSVSLFSGALAMVLLRVISIDEAYQAIDWRTVFLLAGLIPLGIAMEKTGAAAFVADQLMHLLADNHPILLLTAVAVLATLFSLFMSNVAATVLLVPLVMIMGQISGIDPRALALLVAVCASNSFLLPTHQVNALLMAPGGYRNADYLKAGGLMSLVFIIISVGFIYLFFI